MIVIGGGRVGTALAERSAEVGIDCTLVSRQHGWEALAGPPGDPILVTVRNDFANFTKPAAFMLIILGIWLVVRRFTPFSRA